MPKETIKTDAAGSVLSLGWNRERGEVELVAKTMLPEPLKMATGVGGRWGEAVNGVRVGVFWEGIQIVEEGALLINPIVKLERAVNIVATVAKLTVSGNAVVFEERYPLMLSGSGTDLVAALTPVPVPFTNNGYAYIGIGAALSGIAYVPDGLSVEHEEAVPKSASLVETFEDVWAYFQLNRDDINGLIRGLRKARDQVFGRDE